MNIKARAKILIIFFCIFLLLSLGIVVYAAKSTSKEVVYINQNYDISEVEKFMDLHTHYYNQIKYEKVDSESFSFLIQPEVEGVEAKGFEVNDTKFMIHLWICREEYGGCRFRINGVYTDWLQPPTDETEYFLRLNDGYVMKINNLKLNVCNQRFCDYKRDLYDVVNISIMKR